MARKTRRSIREWLDERFPGVGAQPSAPAPAMRTQTRSVENRTDRNRQTAANARARGDAVLRGARSGAINYFDQYSGDPRVAAETKARLDARRRWYAGERFTPSTLTGPRDEKGRTLVGGKNGFSYRRANEARARGAGVTSVTFGEGDGSFTTTSMGDALATARVVARNNDNRQRMLDWLRSQGVPKTSDLYTTLDKMHKDRRGLGFSDAERAAVGAFLTERNRTSTDRWLRGQATYDKQMAALKKRGPSTREDLVALLLNKRMALKGTSSPYGGPLTVDSYGQALSAAGGASALVGYGMGGRGRHMATTGNAAVGFTATDKATADGIVSSGRMSARFTGGGSGYLSALGGGSGSSVNNPAVAFRSMLKTAIGEDPGGRVSGYTPKGNPIFSADRRGGDDHKSFEQKQYERDAADFAVEANRMVSDTFAPGGNGLGIRMRRNARTMQALERYYDWVDRQYTDALDETRQVARMMGIKPGQFGFQPAPELPKPSGPERMKPVVQATPQGAQFIEEELPGE